MIDQLCPVCNKPTPCCPCDLAWLQSRVELQLNYDLWRMQGPFGVEYREKKEMRRAIG
jgi:hypothetical protein